MYQASVFAVAGYTEISKPKFGKALIDQINGRVDIKSDWGLYEALEVLKSQSYCDLHGQCSN